jgi:molecular chaperone HtpG
MVSVQTEAVEADIAAETGQAETGQAGPGDEAAGQETFAFQADVVQILDLMVHSLYSNKEIFLRELISNAADAIDRLRLELLSQAELPEADGPLQIEVSHDPAAGTITVSDNGIGMSRAEVIENIGTIARSGTREFLHALSGDQRKDATLVGQFGVGFYSAFIVADEVTLTSRRSGLAAAEGVRWQSAGTGDYTLETAEVPGRGTTITLHLRAGEEDLLDTARLRSIIQKYSDHISQPILMPGETPAAGADGGQAADPPEPVNQASALWTRPQNDLTESDYNGFYRHITGDYSDPLTWVHSKIEGTYDYTLLLFIPAHAPYDLWLPTASHGVKLHIQRVFVMHDTDQLLPSYLRFVRGVIDSSDLPLNISRELLQGSRAADHIRSSAVKKVLRLLTGLAEDEPEKYATFWREFGSALKEGIADDYRHRDEIARLLRFHSTRSATGEADVSLAGYTTRMKDGQQHIYYLIAPGLTAASASPHLEAFQKNGVEVLLLDQDMDHWVVSSLREFDGKQLQSITHDSTDLSALQDDTDAAATDQASTDYADLVSQLKAVLGNQAHDVRVTGRLTTSPACIVAGEPDTPFSRSPGPRVPAQPVLEINPQHPLIQRLNRTPADPHLAQWAHVLYNQAVLTLGAPIENPAAFTTQLNDLLISLTTQPGAADADAAGATQPEEATDADAAGATQPEEATDADAAGATQPEEATDADAAGATQPEEAADADAAGATQPEEAADAAG